MFIKIFIFLAICFCHSGMGFSMISICFECELVYKDHAAFLFAYGRVFFSCHPLHSLYMVFSVSVLNIAIFDFIFSHESLFQMRILLFCRNWMIQFLFSLGGWFFIIVSETAYRLFSLFADAYEHLFCVIFVSLLYLLSEYCIINISVIFVFRSVSVFILTFEICLYAHMQTDYCKYMYIFPCASLISIQYLEDLYFSCV